LTHDRWRPSAPAFRSRLTRDQPARTAHGLRATFRPAWALVAFLAQDPGNPVPSDFDEAASMVEASDRSTRNEAQHPVPPEELQKQDGAYPLTLRRRKDSDRAYPCLALNHLCPGSAQTPPVIRGDYEFRGVRPGGHSLGVEQAIEEGAVRRPAVTEGDHVRCSGIASTRKTVACGRVPPVGVRDRPGVRVRGIRSRRQ
jgi:hypothetical protein